MPFVPSAASALIVSYPGKQGAASANKAKAENQTELREEQKLEEAESEGPAEWSEKPCHFGARQKLQTPQKHTALQLCVTLIFDHTHIWALCAWSLPYT